MAKIECDEGRRYMIQQADGGRDYLFVSDQDIMITVNNENDYKSAEKRSLAECVCRLASIGMRQGLPMADIIHQFRAADAGRCSLLGEMADRMENYCARQ